MGFRRYILPIESFDREFDAKLLLALHLLSKNKSLTEVVVGFDKAITQILNSLKGPSILLDKSCSDIMHQSRFKPVLREGGVVSVCDEEGVNNITNNFDGLITRFDPEAVKNLSHYYTWGELDTNLARSANIAQSKIKITGNPRLDLLKYEGKKFYEPLSSGLRSYFGDFYLFNENFCIETYLQKYKPPIRSYLSDDEMRKLNDTRSRKRSAASLERGSFVELFQYLVSSNKDKYFIVRPHPMSDPIFWLLKFAKNRNVSVIYRDPAEPWLFACKGLISCGCTTALQAALANVPVYHYSNSSDSYSNSLASNVGLKLTQFTDFSNPYPYFSKDFQYASSVMQFSQSSCGLIANHMSTLASTLPSLPSTSEEFLLGFKDATQMAQPYEPKWREYDLSISFITSKIKALLSSFNIDLSSLRVRKVSTGVFYLSNAN
jgi:surface carbohydrate biosynthesis protein